MARDRYQAGSLWEEKGKWWLRYSERHADGKTDRPTVCVGTTKKYNTRNKARLAADQIMEKVHQRLTVVLWGDLCDSYLESGTAHMRPVCVQNRASVVNKLRDAVYSGRDGKIPFASERIDHLATAAGRIKMEDWLNGQHITANYRRNLRATMRLIFRHAMKHDYLKGDNPVDLIDVSNRAQNTNPKRPRTLITPEQYAQLQNDADLPKVCKVVLAVMQLTGVRGCEALGLSWEHGKKGDKDYRRNDIEFDADPPKIWIRRSVKGHFIDATKTPESERTAALSGKLAGVLLRWKAETPVINDWVFGSTATGRPWGIWTIRKAIKEAAARYGFDYIGFGLHNNRHTFRKAFKDAGAGLEEVMRALGHTNPKTTLIDYGGGNDHAKELAPYTEKVVSIMEGKKPAVSAALSASELPASLVKILQNKVLAAALFNLADSLLEENKDVIGNTRKRTMP